MSALFALLLALVPFAALLRVRMQRRRAALAHWEQDEQLRRWGREIVHTTVALDPSVEHTIWTRADAWDFTARTTLPPLVDARGRRVRFEDGAVRFLPGPHEPHITEQHNLEFGEKHVAEEVVRLHGGSTLLVRARSKDAGDERVLSPIASTYLVRTPSGEFPPIPEPCPRPHVPLHAPVYAAIALAITLTPVAVAELLARIDESLAAYGLLLEGLLVFVAVARARDIEHRIEERLSDSPP